MIKPRLSATTLMLGMSIVVGLCQQPTSAPTPPQKTYRERLMERARGGDADAQFEIGKSYEIGRGVPKDFSQAQNWYRKAADQADPYAELSLGILFNFGKGVPRDYAQAYIWYERAVMHSQGGNQDSIVEMRDRIAKNLTPQQISEAKRLAHEGKPVPKQ